MNLAAIAYPSGDGERTDALLRTVAHDLRTRGYNLAGTVQWNASRPGAMRCDMELEDLSTGERHATASNAPRRPQTCKLDATALEDVAGLVASRIRPGLDLVIVNRFGKQESAGAGFRPIIEAAVASGVPVLTSVNRALVKEWEAFAGGMSAMLDPSNAAVTAWCASVLGSAVLR